MEVKACRTCKRLFNYIAGPVRCPACSDALEKKFQKVKQYIWDHKTASLQEISEENDVSVGQLRQWVREERLCFTADSPVGLECESCGATIKTGRYCDNCKNKLSTTLMSAIPKKEVTEKKNMGDGRNRMRSL
ncbi:MAG: flagellar protein [Lachnospiraceae bacterium]|nr:flagellar protein [bacterium]MDY5518171.1 flagellar protein [Lachnospiraceae bacterium]